MDFNDPNVIFIFMPHGPDGELRWKLMNANGDIMWQRIYEWTEDTEPMKLLQPMLVKLVATLRACHVRDFGH